MSHMDANLGSGLLIWIGICFVFCLWLIKSFVLGRRQFQNNLHVIEDGLRRMQEQIELRQRQKSIGYIENIEDITAALENILPVNIYQNILELALNMRSQKVSVDVWKMMFSSCSYLALAFGAWVMLKLIYACFWLPKYLQNQENEALNQQEKESTEDKEAEENPINTSHDMVVDKKND